MQSFSKGRLFSIILLTLVLVATGGCDNESTEPSATQRAINDLQAKYDELVEDELESPVKWASDDLENIGDWEYKVIDLTDGCAAAMETTLNELGNDRWEVFWIENSNEYRIMLKRPSRSYLSRIPLSQIDRFVIGGKDGQE